MSNPSTPSFWKSALFRHETILLVVLLAEWFYFDFAGRRFGTIENTFEILRHSSEIGLLALVMTPIMLTGGIDLSVGSLLGLCAILFGKMWRDGHFSPALAAIFTVAIGAAAGGLNAALITRLRIPPLIVTLGTYSLFRGLAEAITKGADTFTGFPDSFLALGQDRLAGLPTQAWIFLAVTVGVWLLVHQTTLGRSFRAIGFALEGARYAGLPVQRRIAYVYILAGVVSAMAGIIYTARLGQAKADAGSGYELLAITAVVLGGASIFGGIGSVHGTLLGVAAIAVLRNGLVHTRQPSEVAGILTGALLLFALASGELSKRLAKFRARRHAAAPVSPPAPNSP